MHWVIAPCRSLVTPVTDPHPFCCQPVGVIHPITSRKLVAVVVMLVVTASGTVAQMPGSPDGAHRMALDSSHDGQLNSGHPCCHSSSTASFEIALPPSIPCGSKHSCCLRSAPTSSANLPSSSRGQRPETLPVGRTEDAANRPGVHAPVQISCPGAILLFAALSTVLRI